MNRRFPRWRTRLLSVFFVLIVGILVYRIFVIQVIRYEYYRELADKQGLKKVKWPATRGSIFDRNGSLLAATQKLYAVGVTPRHFARDEGAVEFLAGALDLPVKKVMRQLSNDRSYVPLAGSVHLDENEVAGLSSLPGVKLDQVHDRIYSLRAVPEQLIGAINYEGVGTCGIEAQYQDIFSGEDGWILVNRDARAQTFRLVNAPGQRPVNGCNLYLTIDSRVQEIVDFELEQAINRFSAARGAAIVLDPFTGDILALSEKVVRDCASDQEDLAETSLFSVSCMYEPGSTFKLVTDSYLLEKGTVDPFDVFYAENGTMKFDFGTFRDDHEYDGWLTFKQSFVRSSNICTIKAAKDSDPHDFYRYILRFGFGSRTGISLPAESEGSLREPTEWSARSLASISIGYEIGVTPLQMAMAYCALANGGELVAPRIALCARNEKGRIVKDYPIIRLRRVFSRETARTMKDFCREVVESGTGVKAAVSGLEIAGKTGTSEKFEKGSYRRDKHVASFIGFAPARDPKIVCLVVLDEPKYPYFWGGESAAPVFSRIVRAINVSTDLLCMEAPQTITVEQREEGMIRVPSFLRLDPDHALQLASEAGLQIHYAEEKGTVYAQIPDPGTFIERGREVKLLMRPDMPSKKKSVYVPDLRGLSIREARRLLLACGLRSHIKGAGIVRYQKPGAGTLVRLNSTVRITCDLKGMVDYPDDMRLASGAVH
jgi:cell division protein FtsI/penicillin-binding protein 2